MAESTKVVNGKLEITKSQDVVISYLTKEELQGKINEAQTKVDHLNIDLAAAQKEVDNLKGMMELLK